MYQIVNGILVKIIIEQYNLKYSLICFFLNQVTARMKNRVNEKIVIMPKIGIAYII